MLIKKNLIEFEVDHQTGMNGDWDFWSHVVSDAWEPNTFKVFERFLDKDHAYIDIGAWIGPTVLFGSQLAKEVFAFEPDPNAYSALRKNLSLNPLTTQNVHIFPIAISNSNGTISMGTNSKQGDSMSSMLFSKDSWQVEAATLESMIDSLHITDINFIKMDIEGGEKIVLPAIKNYIHKNQPTFYLALHTTWIEDKVSFLNDVKDTLSIYKNIYTSDGRKILLDEINNLPGFTEILATNQEW